MTNNLTPWIVLGLVVLGSLHWKGYLKLPARAAAFAPPVGTSDPNPAMGNPANSAPVSSVTYGEASPSEAWLLERLDSHTLGVYFALAKRREAETEIAHKIAADAGDRIKATFTAPFSPAGEPAPATPEKPGE
jgi:hypothetical protein